MREILFRAKRVDNGAWVEGYYWQNKVGNHFIRVSSINGEYVLIDYEVVPKTVGEFTGLTDKNGKKIFEGDIVRYSPNLSNTGKVLDTVGVIVWHECGMFVISGHSYWDIGHIFNSECIEWAKIIGNIHDNPELLEVEQ